MIPKPSSQTISLTDGREITIETGKLAKQAHGSVVIKMGDCMLLSTVVSSYNASNVDFLPLTVDYRENLLQLEDSLEDSLKEKQDLVVKKYLQ